jgi:hypothetical protein
MVIHTVALKLMSDQKKMTKVFFYKGTVGCPVLSEGSVKFPGKYRILTFLFGSATQAAAGA